MPGFADSHSHPFSGGMGLTLPQVSYYNVPNPYGDQFKGLKTKEEGEVRGSRVMYKISFQMSSMNSFENVHQDIMQDELRSNEMWLNLVDLCAFGRMI